MAAVTALFFPLLSAQAKDRLWIGGRAGHLNDWNDNNNWEDPNGANGKPGNGDNAVFTGTFTFQPQLTGNTSCGAIWVQAGLGQDVTISSETNEVLTLNENTINGVSGYGIAVESAVQFTLRIKTPLKIGANQFWTNNSNHTVFLGDLGPSLLVGVGGIDLNNKSLLINGTGDFFIYAMISNSNLITNGGALVFSDVGTRTLANDNTYTGLTTVNGGVLVLRSDNALGTTASGTIVRDGGELRFEQDLANNDITVGAEALTLNGTGTAGGGALRNVIGSNSFAGVITLASDSLITSDSGTFTLSGGIVNTGDTTTFGGVSNITETGVISGTGGVVKTDLGTVTLTGANTYTGTTTVSAGILNIQNNTGLGTTAGGTTVASGAGLQLQGGITVGPEALTLNGDGVTAGGSGALRSISGNNSFAGVITLGSDSTIRSDSGSTLSLSGGIVSGGFKTTFDSVGNITQSGVISGIGGVVKINPGIVTLSGANTFTGSTTVTGGTLTLAGSGNGALGSTSGVTVNSGGTVLLGASNQINSTAPMTLNGGTFAKGNFNEGSASTPGVGALTLTASGSHIDFGTGTVGVLTFASFSPGSFVLTIDNWTGTPNMVGSSSTDRLIFASDQSANLNHFLFSGFGLGALEFDLGNGFFEVTPIPEPSTWAGAGLAVGVMGWYLLRRRRSDKSAQSAARNLLLTMYGCALVATTASATPREDIIRAVAVSMASDYSEASPRQVLRAFTAVALRVEPEDLPAYVTAAINLRPDLAPNVVAMALKIAAKTCEERPKILCPTVERIVKAAVAAKPDAVVFIAVAGASARPELVDCVMNAAIAAAPQAKEAIVNAVNEATIPAEGPSGGTIHFGFLGQSTMNPANISEPANPGNVVSPEQPP